MNVDEEYFVFIDPLLTTGGLSRTCRCQDRGGQAARDVHRVFRVAPAFVFERHLFRGYFLNVEEQRFMLMVYFMMISGSSSWSCRTGTS